MNSNKIAQNLIQNGVTCRSVVSDRVFSYSNKIATILGNNPLAVVGGGLAALGLSVSIASASIKPQALDNQVRTGVDNIHIYPVAEVPVRVETQTDGKYTTVNPESIRDAMTNFRSIKPSTNFSNYKQGNNKTLGITLVDSLVFPDELHDSVKSTFGVDANVFYKALSKHESNCGDNMFKQLDLASDGQDIRSIKQLIWSAVRNIQGTSNDIGLLQITPGFGPLKNLNGPIVASRNDLKMQIYGVFLYYNNPSLFKSAMENTKVNSPHTIALLNNSKIHIENYLKENNKTQINKEDLFNVLARIDIRFDNQKMGVLVMNSFINDYKKVSIANPNLSKKAVVRLILNRYNQGNNATIEAYYASIILSNIKKYSNLGTIETADINVKPEPKQQATLPPEVKPQDSSEVRMSVVPVSSPKIKIGDSTFCSRTAETNLKKFVPSSEVFLNGDAKHIVSKLLKTSKTTTAKDIIGMIQESEDNVFDIYINNKLGHRMILVKNGDDIFVLDPYYTNTKKGVPVSQYKPFELTGKHFIIGPSYISPLFKTADQKSVNTIESGVNELGQESKADTPAISYEQVSLINHVNKITGSILTSPKVLTTIKDENMRTQIAQKLEQAPLEVQIAHYETDPSKVSTLKKLYEIDYKTKFDQLENIKQKLIMVTTGISKIENGNFTDEFSKTRLDKFNDAKYTLEKQISYLETSLAEIEGKDVYKYAMRDCKKFCVNTKKLDN